MQTSEVEVNEVQAAYAEGLKDGQKLEFKRVLDAIKYHTCFDHLAESHCDHAACWSLSYLKDYLLKND